MPNFLSLPLSQSSFLKISGYLTDTLWIICFEFHETNWIQLPLFTKSRWTIISAILNKHRVYIKFAATMPFMTKAKAVNCRQNVLSVSLIKSTLCWKRNHSFTENDQNPMLFGRLSVNTSICGQLPQTLKSTWLLSSLIDRVNEMNVTHSTSHIARLSPCPCVVLLNCIASSAKKFGYLTLFLWRFFS